MADNTNIDAVIGDLVSITIGGDTAALHARIAFDPPDGQFHPVTSGRTGGNIIKMIEMNSCPSGTITWQQSYAADVQRMFGVSGAAPRQFPASVGAVAAETTLQIHDLQAADANGDIHLYRVALGMPQWESDGEGHKQLTQRFQAMLVMASGATQGKVGRIGPAS